MLDELQRRNYAKTTVQYYIQAVERFAKHFHRSPDQLNRTHLREYQAYLSHPFEMSMTSFTCTPGPKR